MPAAIIPIPATRSTGVSLPEPVKANPEEPPPVFPVDDGLLTTAATVDEVVVVEAGTVVDVVEVVEVVEDVVVVVDEVVVVVGSGVTEQQAASPVSGTAAVYVVPPDA
jgi:hypothetical protein